MRGAAQCYKSAVSPPRIHSSAEVEPGALVGDDSTLWRNVHVMSGARLGARCVLGQGCFVAAGVQIGDGCRIQNNVSLYQGVILAEDVFVGPSAVFTNVKRPRAAFPTPRERFLVTRVGRGASIGANATVVCGVSIGEGAMIAAGAVVTRDVPPYTLALGQPARVVGFVCACGAALPDSLQCACGRAYERDGEGLSVDHKVAASSGSLVPA